MSAVTLHRVSPSNAETAEYEGTYKGVGVRVTRLTDPNDDGGRPETRWDGFMWDPALNAGKGDWSNVALCYGSRRAALEETCRWIDRSQA